MEASTFKPQSQMRTLWLICWAIPFFIGLAILLPLLLFAEGEAFVIFVLILVGWLLIMVPVAIWIPAYYRSLQYAIEPAAIKAKGGVFWKRQVTVPMSKITHIDITQGPLQRAFNLATIHVQTAGAGGQEGGRAELRLLGMGRSEQIKETIMQCVRQDDIPRPATREGHATDVFGSMLAELSAIRQLLEDKSR